MSPRGLRVIRWELALFWSFALGAFIGDRKSAWRIALAVLCAAIGTVMWVLAMKENGLVANSSLGWKVLNSLDDVRRR